MPPWERVRRRSADWFRLCAAPPDSGLPPAKDVQSWGDRAIEMVYVNGLIDSHIQGGVLEAGIEKTVGFVHESQVLRAAFHFSR